MVTEESRGRWFIRSAASDGYDPSVQSNRTGRNVLIHARYIRVRRMRSVKGDTSLSLSS